MPLTKRSDYRPPAWLVDSIALRVELDAENVQEPSAGAKTLVTGRLEVRRNPAASPCDAEAPLRLDGEAMSLLRLSVDGSPLDAPAYQLDGHALNIPLRRAQASVEYAVEIAPRTNTALMGLYCSRGMFCTQCEPEGFRRIAFFPDRPDVMSVYTTTIVADSNRFPVMLANGNMTCEQELDDGRRAVEWHDPHPKPSYLFALVAGDLDCVRESFVTASGRPVELLMYVEKKDAGKCGLALDALQRAMRWDERRYGLEYDLDAYRIVAVDDFNAGAMENKGLNIFNTACVFASPHVATDMQCMRIESIVAHEYFHNWSGNRVTLRDWFQLTLKEGLTVFRDQQFFAEQNPDLEARIPQAAHLRSVQFAEDQGPLAHPPRPDSYREIANFYTSTVYEKGAEIVRMLWRLLGDECFLRGAALYFERHDGRAATCEDLVEAMAEASGRDLTQFMDWYAQAGTPELRVWERYDEARKSYCLDIEQSARAASGGAGKNFHIPLRVSLLGPSGKRVPIVIDGHDCGLQTTLELTRDRHRFAFEKVAQKPAASLLCDFAAPVKVFFEQSPEVLAHIATCEPDPFARWDAAQQLMTRALVTRAGCVADGEAPSFAQLRALFAHSLTRAHANRSHCDLMLTPPSYDALFASLNPEQRADPLALAQAGQDLLKEVAAALAGPFKEVMLECASDANYRLSASEVARRALHNRCMAWLASLNEPWVTEYCVARLRRSDNMTDSLAALTALVNGSDARASAEALDLCYRRWREEPLALNHWLQVQAACRLPGTLARVRALLEHPQFDFANPNQVRSLIGSFGYRNPTCFHQRDGSGYAFLGDCIEKLDGSNPQIAVQLLEPLTRWRRLVAPHRDAMRERLELLASKSGISPELAEMTEKALAD